MEPLGGDSGAQALLLNCRMNKKGREYYRDRIAGLPDAAKLERLIRETFGA